MKISKLRIKNLFGITEFEANGKDLEIAGKNGVGKTSIIDAVKFALQNKSDRQYLIREGQTEGEVLIETDSGLTIHRKAREGKAPYKSIKEGHVDRTEGFLREIFTELQLNPMEFASMTEQEQNRIILDLIDFKWGLDWIKEQFGEIVPDVNYSQNILAVLYEIQAEDGYYFLKRQDINREARNKAAFIAEIGATLPPNYSAASWVSFNLGAIYKRIEQIRNKNGEIERAKGIVKGRENKTRSHEADFKIEVNAIERETSSERTALEKHIAECENLIKAAREKLAGLEEKKINKTALAQKTYEAAVAECEGEAKQFEALAAEEILTYADLQAEAENAEKMKAFVNEYNRMVSLQSDVELLQKQSQDLTDKIEKARALPGVILQEAKVPIQGLTVKDGIPLINGLPISNLSEGEKFELCISIATKNPNSLNMLLIDGIEKLATAKRDQVYADLKAKGCQFIATRTSDDEALTVVEL